MTTLRSVPQPPIPMNFIRISFEKGWGSWRCYCLPPRTKSVQLPSVPTPLRGVSTTFSRREINFTNSGTTVLRELHNPPAKVPFQSVSEARHRAALVRLTVERGDVQSGLAKPVGAKAVKGLRPGIGSAEPEFVTSNNGHPVETNLKLQAWKSL
jgi:hypothetical protein